MTDSDRPRLVLLLRRAAAEMAAIGAARYLGEFGDCLSLAAYLDKCAFELESGDGNSFDRLYGIFAPTCDWDDAGGSLAIGNETFALLNHMRPSSTS